MAAETLTALAKDESFRRASLDAAKNVGHGMLKGFGVVETDPESGSTKINTGSISEFIGMTPKEKAWKAIKVGGPAVAREVFRSGSKIASEGRRVMEDKRARDYADTEYSDVGLTAEDHNATDEAGVLFTPEAVAFLNGEKSENPTVAAEKPILGPTIPFRPSRVPEGDVTLHFGTKPEDFGWQTPGNYNANLN